MINKAVVIKAKYDTLYIYGCLYMSNEIKIPLCCYISYPPAQRTWGYSLGTHTVDISNDLGMYSFVQKWGWVSSPT